MSDQTLWIARHGNRLDFVNPEWFTTAERRYDPPLSDDGHIQAQELAERLSREKITRIFCSPFLRTIQTANAVAQRLDLPLHLEAGLGEWHNPEWMKESPELHPQKFLAEHYPQIDWSYHSRLVPQYPESLAELDQRTGAIAQQLTQEFADDECLFVGHGASVVRTTIGLLGGNPQINASLCALVKLVHEADEWQMELAGDTSHLSQSETQVRFN